MARKNDPFELIFGTSQKDRLLPPLNPDAEEWPKIDGRTTADLKAFAHEFSKYIRFFDNTNRPDGTWEKFFDESQQDESNPHYALFLAFLMAYKHAQEQINTITQRHLEFYYKRVLHFENRPAVPDRVHVLFELAKNAWLHRIEKGTPLNAGKDKQGNQLIYITDDEIVVNRTQIEFVKTLYVDNYQRFYVRQEARKKAIKDADGKTVYHSWPLFGEKLEDKSIWTNPDLDYELGFAIASPILECAEGDRTITLDLISSHGSDKIKLDLNDNSLLAYFSGEKEWIGPFETESDDITEKQISIVVQIPADRPAITNYSTKLNGIKLNADYPVMKVVLNPRAYKFGYNPLKHFKIESADITVEVGLSQYHPSISNLKGIKTLELSNDSGNIDPASVFMPFGPAPQYGANFLIHCSEAFKKNILESKIKWTWLDMPDLAEHYKNYADVTEQAVVSADDFTAMSSVSGLIKGREVALGSQEIWEIFVNPEISISTTLRGESGYIRLMLTGPLRRDLRFTCLGHKEYSNLYTERVMHNSKVGLADTVQLAGLPERPWVPKAKDISLSYKAKSNLMLEDQNTVQFMHITPFGANNVNLWRDNGQYLLPQFRGSLGPFEPTLEGGERYEDLPYGYLFIGLKDLKPPQKVSFLFQMAEGTGNDDIQTDLTDIKWFYLKNNQWVSFSDSKYGPDYTFGLNASGIVGLTITEEATDKNSILPEGLYWICAANIKDPDGVSRAINIHTQAVSATFSAIDEYKKDKETPLNPGSISQLMVKDKAVIKLEQPYPSFGYITAETVYAFFQRVSERLRHRSRGVDRWDYEHLLLQKFRDINTVKCLNKTDFLTKEQAGSVSLIVVPDLRRVAVLDKLEPRLQKGMLEQAEYFLKSKISLFITLAVQNPIYEQIRVHAKVRYYNQYDPGEYTAILNQKLIEYLAPWAFDEGVDLVFGGIIYKSEILDFIEELYFVDKVSDFWIEQITHGYGETGIGYMEIRDVIDADYLDDDTFIVGYEVNIAKATTPRSVLTSVKEHVLTIW